MSSKSIDLYSSQFESDYQSVSQLDRYDLNDSFIDDSQCSIDVNVVAIFLCRARNHLIQQFCYVSLPCLLI